MNRTDDETVYIARWIFPMCDPPINGGYVRLIDGVIVEIGSTSDPAWCSTGAIDLGDVALLPRLVNAHTHLEFSDCDQVIGESGIPLADWIGKVIAARGAVTEEQRRANLSAGLTESLRCGVGLLGDIATTPQSYPAEAEISILSFAEVLGLSPERSAERLAAADLHAESLAESEAVTFGVSPHAPYSTPINVIDRCVELANRNGATLAMHVAESPDERELLEHGTGRFSESLRRVGLWQEGLFPWQGPTPVLELIDRLAKAPRALLVHGNDLKEEEIARISGHDQLSIVYCPRTHDFFGYSEHPVGKLLDAGVRVALGTDSRASNPDLNLWREVQFLLNRRPDLDPYEVLEMATKCGADAMLGAGSEFGTMVTGTGGLDSLVAVRTSAKHLGQVWRDFADQELLCSGVFVRP